MADLFTEQQMRNLLNWVFTHMYTWRSKINDYLQILIE